MFLKRGIRENFGEVKIRIAKTRLESGAQLEICNGSVAIVDT